MDEGLHLFVEGGDASSGEQDLHAGDVRGGGVANELEKGADRAIAWEFRGAHAELEHGDGALAEDGVPQVDE